MHGNSIRTPLYVVLGNHLNVSLNGPHMGRMLRGGAADCKSAEFLKVSPILTLPTKFRAEGEGLSHNPLRRSPSSSFFYSPDQRARRRVPASGSPGSASHHHLLCFSAGKRCAVDPGFQILYGSMSHGVEAGCKPVAFMHGWFDSSTADHFEPLALGYCK